MGELEQGTLSPSLHSRLCLKQRSLHFLAQMIQELFSVGLLEAEMIRSTELGKANIVSFMRCSTKMESL